ncbi:DUF6053 domain-containing protein [Lysobacter enzymogenes]|uniref:DUF6053 domain-containing protein n=1 Tax=Lysobacter enzymogenes TaxID=69 RepID=UPI003D18AAD5
MRRGLAWNKSIGPEGPPTKAAALVGGPSGPMLSSQPRPTTPAASPTPAPETSPSPSPSAAPR